MATGPVSGATSTATTGTWAAAPVFNTVPAAELSKGEKMMPLAPRGIAFFTPVICLAVSNSELKGSRSSTPCAFASVTINLLYAVQKGEVRVVRSTAIFGASAAEAARETTDMAEAASAAVILARRLVILRFLPVELIVRPLNDNGKIQRQR